MSHPYLIKAEEIKFYYRIPMLSDQVTYVLNTQQQAEPSNKNKRQSKRHLNYYLNAK